MEVEIDETRSQRAQKAEERASRAIARAQRRDEMNERLAQMELEYRDILEDTEEEEDAPPEVMGRAETSPLRALLTQGRRSTIFGHIEDQGDDE